MPSDRDEILRRAYVQIKQLADNPPEVAFTHDVNRYHEQLARLASIGCDVEEFRIHPEDTFSFPDRQPQPGFEYQVHHQVFTRKVRALVLYFDIRDKSVRYLGPVKDTDHGE